jgi:hypothetical protein
MIADCELEKAGSPVAGGGGARMIITIKKYAACFFEERIAF